MMLLDSCGRAQSCASFSRMRPLATSGIQADHRGMMAEGVVIADSMGLILEAPLW